MSPREKGHRRRKVADILVAIVTQDFTGIRSQDGGAAQSSEDVSSSSGGASVFERSSRSDSSDDYKRFPLALQTTRDPALMKSKSLVLSEPRHVVIQATNDQDVCSEDVADRNIARERRFPPRVSSAALKKPSYPAGNLSAQVKSRPMTSQDKYFTIEGDWDTTHDRSPMGENPSDMPKPLVIKKRAPPMNRVRFESTGQDDPAWV